MTTDTTGTSTADPTGLRIFAPWTPAQVDALNAYQRAGSFHPFTCANRDTGHPTRGGDHGVLVATVDGWVCPDCDYTQTWAHSFMAEALPQPPAGGWGQRPAS